MTPPPRHTEDILAGLNGRVAIIGNATPTRDLGELIDRYDFVIRMNNFRTEGFERLVGRKTTHRCTTGWTDVEHRAGYPEFSPFAADVAESANVAAFNAANVAPLLTARTDVHPLIPEVKRPSTGLALVQLCAHIGLPVDLFAFDGFKTAHYWEPEKGVNTIHSLSELDFILRRPGVVLYGETMLQEMIPCFPRASDPARHDQAARKLLEHLRAQPRGQRILLFGAGDGELPRLLEAQGHRVTAVTPSRAAGEQIQCSQKIHGPALALALLKESFDLFVAVHSLERLTDNDCRLALREGARLCSAAFVAVAIGAARSPEAWRELMQTLGFDASISSTDDAQQFVLAGARRNASPVGQMAPGAEPDDLRAELARVKEQLRAEQEQKRALEERLADVNEHWQSLLDSAQRGAAQRLEQHLHNWQRPLADGRVTGGRRELEQAAALAPEDADLLVCVGHLQAGQGDIEAARKSYAQALTAAPDHVAARERLIALALEATPPARDVDGSSPQSSGKRGDETVPAPAKPRVTPKSKEEHELDYWKKRKEQEGTLGNTHYRRYFTTHFDLPYEFYAGKRLLDIGSGPRGSLEWADNALERVGLDVLADRYAELGTAEHKMRYVASGSEAIPFPDDYFDVVTSFNSLDHVADLSKTVPEITRVVKPGGVFLLLTDVNHLPTPCEPLEFSWDVVERFKSSFEILEERHFEKPPKAGLYTGVNEAIPYDHGKPGRRSGVLSVKFRRLPVAAQSNSATKQFSPSTPKLNSPLPLTPALSPSAGERESRHPSLVQSEVLGSVPDPNAVLPLPRRGGEGRGEGEMATGREYTSPAQPEIGAQTTKHNQEAFPHLQRAFVLLKERKFTEAQAECLLYREQVDYDALPRTDNRRDASPQVSVVIVAYKIGQELIQCLDSLAASPAPPHEIIVVDNGGNEDIADELSRRPLLHVRMPMNVILSEGRNVGVHFARAPMASFVDDDAIVAKGYLASVVAAFATFDICAFRGKVLPKSDHPNNGKARHYNLGELAIPADVDTEGNSAFAIEVFRAMGGMDPLLFGMEGTELSHRIAKQRGDYVNIYWPGAVIYHDYANTDDKLGTKHARHLLMRDYALFKHADLMERHNRIAAFAQSDSARRTGQRLIRRRGEAVPSDLLRSPCDGRQIEPSSGGLSLSPVEGERAGVRGRDMSISVFSRNPSPCPLPFGRGEGTPQCASAVDSAALSTEAGTDAKQPFISVCIPTYNRADLLSAAVSSALQQTYPHCEIVVVDDGSTDNTPAVMQKLVSDKVRYVRKEHSGGPATRNRCVAEARGEFIVWLDSDDLLLPRTLEIYAAELARRPFVDALYGDLRVVNQNLEENDIWTYRDYLGWSEALLSDLVLENRVPNVCTLVRKSCYAQFGGYDEAFPRAHDYEFWTRLAPHCVFGHIREVVGIYRQHAKSLSQHGGQTDTSHEARVVQKLAERHGVRPLLPYSFGPGAPAARSEANAWRILALLVFSYGDVPAARDYLRRSLAAGSLPQTEKLHRLLHDIFGPLPGAKSGKAPPVAAGRPLKSEFEQLVETAVRGFKLGRDGDCIRASARLSEVRPEAVETLVLIGLSLIRWGDARMGRTALKCLVERATKEACNEAAADECSADFQSAGSPTCSRQDVGMLPAAGGLPIRDTADCKSPLQVCGAAPDGNQAPPKECVPDGLTKALARVLGVDAVPDPAVRETLTFAQQMAAAPDPRRFAMLHRAGLTPLLFALVGLTDDELRGLGGEELVKRVQAARAGLVLTPSGPVTWPQLGNTTAARAVPARSSHERCQPQLLSSPTDSSEPLRAGTACAPVGTPARLPGYSFCIITNGQRPDKLRRQIESIRALGIPQFEILVGGDLAGDVNGATVVPMPEAARAGRLGQMRNALARQARFDHLVVSDDDIVFHADFFQGMQRFGEDYEAMAVRMFNPDGSRFWDWATIGGPRGQVLLDYWDNDPNVYVTGGLCVLKASVIAQVAWDENRGFYQGEDVDFSRRLRAAGIPLRFNPHAAVTHDDDRYTRIGRKVFRFDTILAVAAEHRQNGEVEIARRFLSVAWRLAQNDAARRQELSQVASMLGEATWLLGSGAGVPPAIKDSSPSNPPSPALLTGGTPVVAGGTLAPLNSVTVHVAWEGSFLDLGSLSHVNRELTAQLSAQPSVQLARVGKNMIPPVLATMPALQTLAPQLEAQSAAATQVTVRHEWPPRWHPPQHGAWVLIQPWEFGSLPADWVKQIKKVDEVWAPSEYVRRVYVESGVPAAKVHVVPNGVNPELFHPRAKPMALATKKTFKFLFVGGTIFRKGPEILLKAYLENFTASDDVCLIIKDFGGQSVYAGQTLEKQIKAAQSQPNAPEILYLTGDFAAEDIAGLFTACDSLVHPYRGEGFGLPVLEAMACGLPVVVTGGGSTDDFATDEFAYRLPSRRASIGRSVSGLKLAGDGWVLEPDAAALGARMKWIFGHRDEARAKGRAASEHARREWSWERAAQIAAQRLRVIAASRVQQSREGVSPAPAPGGKKIELPPCAWVGHLKDATALFQQRQFLPAWNAALAAVQSRPFHPEAYLLLGEIALAAGDVAQARHCAERARQFAPLWKPAKKFRQALPGKPAPPKMDWPLLPGSGPLTDAKTPPRLTVCLITKNEEKFLGQCLSSVRGVAQQIVVVDTGSTDRTIEIAKQHGAEVYHFDWADDFSAARNASLEHATGDWILALDADEELLPESRAALLKEMQHPAVMAWRLPMIDQGREAEGRSYVPRLFRNAPGLFYVGRVHEQVFSSIEVRRKEWGLENRLGATALLHHGYVAAVVKDRDKVARNLRLLELAIAEMPDEPNLLMNLGLELVRSNRLEEGLDRYREAFRVMSVQPRDHLVPELREMLLSQFCTQLMNAREHSEIVRVLQSPLARAGGLTASQHFALGLAFMELKQFKEAAEQMKHCLSKRRQPCLSPVNVDIQKAGPHHCLALCLDAGGQPAAAEAAFKKAIAEDSASRPARFDYACFLYARQRPLEALDLLNKLVAEKADDAPAWRLGGQIALSRADYLQFASDWTSVAIQQLPDDETVIEQRAHALLLSGQPADALPLWRRLQATAQPHRQAALLICELAADSSDRLLGPPHGPSVSQEFLKWYQRLIQANAAKVVHDLNARIETLRRVVPEAARKLEAALAEASEEPRVVGY